MHHIVSDGWSMGVIVEEFVSLYRAGVAGGEATLAFVTELEGGKEVTLRAGMRFWFCDAFSLDFGYRLIEAGIESEEYELTGGLQGLFLSGTIRF